MAQRLKTGFGEGSRVTALKDFIDYRKIDGTYLRKGDVREYANDIFTVIRNSSQRQLLMTLSRFGSIRIDPIGAPVEDVIQEAEVVDGEMEIKEEEVQPEVNAVEDKVEDTPQEDVPTLASLGISEDKQTALKKLGPMPEDVTAARKLIRTVRGFARAGDEDCDAIIALL